MAILRKKGNFSKDKIFFLNKKPDRNSFSFDLEVSKCPNTDLIVDFLKSRTDKGLLKYIDFKPKQKYGLKVVSAYSSLDYLKQSKELQDTLDALDGFKFKGHNAKNNYLRIRLLVNKMNHKTVKKIDLFMNNHPEFCKKLARKLKSPVFSKSIRKRHIDLGKNISERRPLDFSKDVIEFNFFRSTLKYETIMASIEFCNCLYNFLDNRFNFDELYSNDSYIEKTFMKYMLENTEFLAGYLRDKKIKLKKENYLNIIHDRDYTNNLETRQPTENDICVMLSTNNLNLAEKQLVF